MQSSPIEWDRVNIIMPLSRTQATFTVTTATALATIVAYGYWILFSMISTF